MNYYQHHIGDFNNATRHLTRIERSVYRDMVELYYDTEKPLPLDVAVICRKVVARTEEEKAAVLALLDEFFKAAEDGYRHDRCDAELANAAEAMGDAEDRRQNERERQKRNRERRRDLFAKLREYDEVPAWNTSTETLLSRIEYHLSRVTGSDETSTSRVKTGPATANHIPITTDQTTTTQIQAATELASDARSVTAVSLSIAFRSSGILTQPANPMLIELASQGVQPETVTAACEEAKAAKPGEQLGVGYVVAILKRWAADAARVKVQGAARPDARASPAKQPAAHNLGGNAPEFSDPFARKV